VQGFEADIVAVVGATASGKSVLADALAVHLDGEVVSADSMQVYRGMDVGTAKVVEESRGVYYHGIDLVDPDQVFSAAFYQRYAREVIADITARGKQVIFCGGTGLYLRAALDDFELDQGRDGDSGGEQARREQLRARAELIGAGAFHRELAELDARSAALIHPNNVRRVIRAFEHLEQGTSYAEVTAGFGAYEGAYAARYIGLRVERELLYQLIDARVDIMIKSGLLGEVQVLLSEGFDQTLTSMQAIGYKEIVPVLTGEVTLQQAVLAIKQASRRYAKRQETWFQRDPRIEWIEVSDLHRARLAAKVDEQEFRQLMLGRALEVLR